MSETEIARVQEPPRRLAPMESDGESDGAALDRRLRNRRVREGTRP